MAVMPGATSNRITPGGMPDSRQSQKPGPIPSMPKMGAGPADFGVNSGAPGVPDPGDLEDLFLAYTSGQMSRDDLIGRLGTLGEGEGGILGLLESMDQNMEGSRTGMADQAVDVIDSQGGAEQSTQPAMPGGVMPGVGLEVGGSGPRGGQGMGQATTLGSIPPLTEPLDARHQRISILLQGFGLEPVDADQMSTVLNPHVKGHKRTWSSEDNMWIDQYDDPSQGVSGTIAYDPTITAEQLKTTPSIVRGTGAQEMRAQAGTGMAIGSKGAARVERYDESLNQGRGGTRMVDIGDVGLQKKLDTGDAGMGAAEGGGTQFVEQAWTEPKAAAAPFKRTGLFPSESAAGEFGETDPDTYDRWELQRQAEDRMRAQDEAEQRRLRLEAERAQALMDEELFKNTAKFHPMFGGSFDIREQGLAVQDKEGNWFPDQSSLDQYTAFLTKAGKYWDGSQIGFGRMISGQAYPEEYWAAYDPDGNLHKFRTQKQQQDFSNDGRWPDGTYLAGFGPGAERPPPKAKVEVNDEDGTTTTTNPDGSVVVTDTATGEVLSGAPLGGDPDVAPPVAADDDSTEPWMSEDYLYGKQLFTPGSVQSRKYPGLASLVQSITEGGTRSESITATVINAVKEMEAIKAQEGQNQFQRMQQVSIAQLDRQAVTDRANLDRALATGVATGKIAGVATLAAESEKNAQLMREYQLSGMMPADWAGEAGAGVKTLGREEMEIRQQEVGVQALSVEQRREQDLSALFGQYISPDVQPVANALTLDAQKWGWTKKMQEAELTGLFPDGADGMDTMSSKRLTFEKDVAAQKNTWETSRIENEAKSIANQQEINNYSISANESIEANKLSEAVAARKAKYRAEEAKLQLDKEKLKIETLLSLAEPATFLFATRFGLLDNLGIALGVDFSDEMYPGQIPSMLEPGTIPTMQQLRAATPAERQLMLAEMAATGGYSVEEALSRVQAGTPGGRAIQRQRNVAAVR